MCWCDCYRVDGYEVLLMRRVIVVMGVPSQFGPVGTLVEVPAAHAERMVAEGVATLKPEPRTKPRPRPETPLVTQPKPRTKPRTKPESDGE